MKSFCFVLVALAVFFVPCRVSEFSTACGQELAPDKEVETAIRQFFSSLSKRDVDGMRAVLSTHFMGIEAAGQGAGLEVIDTDKPEKLLPPEGNEDWRNVKIVGVKVERSPTHPSVAIASFTLAFPLDAKQIVNYRKALKSDFAKQLGDAQKKAITKMLDDRAVHNSMFAMLARQNGKWKIVCMSFPK